MRGKREDNTHLLVHLFLHSQTFPDQSLSSKHCTKHWRHKVNRTNSTFNRKMSTVKCNARLNTLQLIILMGGWGKKGLYWRTAVTALVPVFTGVVRAWWAAGRPSALLGKDAPRGSLQWATCQGLPERHTGEPEGWMSGKGGYRESESSKFPSGCEQHTLSPPSSSPTHPCPFSLFSHCQPSASLPPA